MYKKKITLSGFHRVISLLSSLTLLPFLFLFSLKSFAICSALRTRMLLLLFRSEIYKCPKDRWKNSTQRICTNNAPAVRYFRLIWIEPGLRPFHFVCKLFCTRTKMPKIFDVHIFYFPILLKLISDYDSGMKTK